MVSVGASYQEYVWFEEQGELAGLLQVLQYSHMVLNHAVFGSIGSIPFFTRRYLYDIFQVDCKATALWVG